jgi:hypothetical protein
MRDLTSLQHDFVQALRDPEASAGALASLAGDATTGTRGLAIYRANMAAAADKALAAAFPVTRQLLGDGFAALAHAYQHAHPSASGDLGEFGDALPAFVAAFEPTRSLPWLPDLARLELAAHQAYGAADAPAWDATTLAAVAPQDEPRLRFALAPGLAVIPSAWPVVRLWSVHQAGFAGEPSVDWDATEHALVAREGFAVTVHAVSADEAAFLARTLAGAALGDAVDAALQAESAFDLGALLGRLFAAGLVCGFTLEELP